ncbi:hypothetical protein P12x_004691 [Tundrisphaera lichenicola]|uniref:hypothetical protein n=1 Tax=Tundrisphaera lichenicola TaxID=2029860 RepID=UPI003EC0F1DE
MMPMKIVDISTIEFRDPESGSLALAMVRRCGNWVVLGMSIQANGDFDVVIDLESARKLAEGIGECIKAIENNDSIAT